jgi:hypothetical protein
VKAEQLRRGDRCDFHGRIDFLCPFCKGKCFAALEPLSVVHLVPTCPRFDELEPDEFLDEVNTILEAQGNPTA